MSRPVCVHCGKRYGRRDTHDVRLRWEKGEPKPRYEGNLQVVRSVMIVRPYLDIEVWNGRDWYGGYPPFCTLRCALDYARRAFARSQR